MKYAFDQLSRKECSSDSILDLASMLRNATGDVWEILEPENDFEVARTAFLLANPDEQHRFIYVKDVFSTYPKTRLNGFHEEIKLGEGAVATITTIGTDYASVTVKVKNILSIMSTMGNLRRLFDKTRITGDLYNLFGVGGVDSIEFEA